MAPQSYDIHTPQGKGGGSSGRLVLDLILARIDKHQYTDSAPETWHRNIRAYLLGRHSSMKPILDSIERMGDTKITVPYFQWMCGQLMVDLEPGQVGQELWSWLYLTLEKSTSAQRTFHNVEELNGAELYRRLVAPLGNIQPECQQTRRPV